MKKIRRFAAVLLAAAMVVTSIHVPVYAAPDDSIVIEQEDLQESSASVDEDLAGKQEPEIQNPDTDPTEEEPVKEPEVQNPAEEEPAKEPEAQNPAEESVKEPEAGAPVEESTEGDSVTEVSSEEETAADDFEEIVVGQSEEEADESLDESVTGNDDTIYVGDAKEFLQALKEASQKKDAKGNSLPAVIELREPNYSLKDEDGDVKDADTVQAEIEAYDAAHFLISKAVLGDQKMEITAGDVTIKGNGHSISFLDEAVDAAVMTVASGASLTLENRLVITDGWKPSQVSGTFGFKIENSGTFRAENAHITYAKAVAFVNKAKASASFEGGSVRATATPMDGVAAIHNEADAELVIGGTQNGSQAEASEITAEVDNASAILNEGSLILNHAEVSADGAEGCAIFNNGEKAELSIRGGDITSDQSAAVYNTAKLEIGSPFAYGADVKITANGSVPAVLSPGGSVAVRCADEHRNDVAGWMFQVAIESSSAFGVSTTANVLDAAGKKRYPGTGDGSLTMYGGRVAGIAYAGENYPVILGGVVSRAGGACVPYKADGTTDEVTKAHYYWYDSAESEPARQLMNAFTGAAFDNLLKLPERSDAEIGNYWKTVGADGTLAELVKAKTKYIRILGQITLDAPLVLDYDVTIRGDRYSYSTGIIVEGANTITVTKDANVILEELSITGGSNPLTGDAPKVIANAGNLTLKKVNINPYGSSISATGNVKGRIVENTGTVTLLNDDAYNSGIYAGADFTAVHNNGVFIMQNGMIQASGEGSHAILYEGENVPVLVRGVVYGAGYSDQSTGSEKAAVAKWDGAKAVTGQFKNTTDAGALLLPAKDSTCIRDGIAQADQLLGNSEEVPDEYLLMEAGEYIEEANIRNIFDVYSRYTNAVLKLNSSAQEVVETKDAPLTITAKAKGHAIVTFGLYESEKEDARLITANYLRIDVVGQGRRDKLVSDHFTGNILNPNVVVNGYKTKSNEPVKFEFHLTDSYGEEAVGADNFDAIKAGTYNVDSILIDDKEFREYFQANKRGDGEGGYLDTHYDAEKKLYSFELETLRENGNKSYVGGPSTKLVVDDVRKIDNVKVSAVLKDAAERTIVVPVGAFNISVKSSVPKFKVNPVNINRFYENDYNWFAYTITNDPNERIDEYGSFSGTAGIEVDTDGEVITVSGKKGGKVSSAVKVTNYVGTYPFSANVKVTNKAPKVSLRDKKISIYGKTSAETDINTALLAKTKPDDDYDPIDRVSDIKVVGKSAEFYKAANLESRSWDAKGTTHYLNFALQPKKAVVKAMTVDLEVSFEGARKVKGKPYVVKLKLKVSPVDYNKFSVKQINNPATNYKPRINKTPLEGNVADSTKVFFTLNPRTYKGGKFIVTGLNGKGNASNPLPESLSFNSVRDEGNGNYSVTIAANAKTKDEKAKTVKFAVQLIAPNEQGKFMPVLKKQAVMTVNLYDAKEPELKKTDASIDLSKVKYQSKTLDTDISTKLKATYKVTGAVGTWSVTADSALFGAYPTRNKNGDITSVVLTPDADAYFAGRILVGNKYTVNLTFDNGRGTRKIIPVTVSVKDVKKADAVIYNEYYDRYDNMFKIKKSEFTLYYNSPYTLDNFQIGETVNWGSVDYSTAPYMGLMVKDVAVDESKGASPYEVIRYRSANGSHYEYALTFKDKTKTGDAAALKKAKTVTLKITYSNGIKDDYVSSLKKVKVNIPDLPKK